jgi:gas vesicle protein
MSEEYQTKPSTTSALIKGILIGGLIGVGVALLTAPRSGERTREIIKEKSMDIRDRVRETADEKLAAAERAARTTSMRAEELKEVSQEKLNQQKAKLTGIVEGVKEGVKTYKEYDQADEVNSNLPAPTDLYTPGGPQITDTTE